MLLREIVRFSSQHRTLYCYLILSIWIFLLIGGMYKYIGSSPLASPSLIGNRPFYSTVVETVSQSSADSAEQLIRGARKYQHECNSPETITTANEGGMLEGWTLQGVLLLTRHGDRGPMVHVKGITGVDCGVENEPLLTRYTSFIRNATAGTPIGHSASWMRPGSFHGFPLLPPLQRACLLGQLTYRGVAQMLRVGEILRQSYAHSLGLGVSPQLGNPQRGANNQTTAQSAEDIVVFSTRYRRTFQSAMALLFALLPSEKWSTVTVHESHSLSFCFADCACPEADAYRKQAVAERAHLYTHLAVTAVVQWIGGTLLQNPAAAVSSQASLRGNIEPLEVREALLAFICHGATLPCRRDDSQPPSVDATSDEDPDTTTALSDVINIDQDDDGSPAGVDGGARGGGQVGAEADTGDSEADGCIESPHVAALMSYAGWRERRESQSVLARREGLLRSYGLIRTLVGHILRMMSSSRTKLVLFSGHDLTVKYLSAALGLATTLDPPTPFVPYAARMVFELYRSDAISAQYYFRLLYNGNDVTRRIHFCEDGKSLRVRRGVRGGKADLCPVENIIRFIHDDYFAPLNATNFKDACAGGATSREFK